MPETELYQPVKEHLERCGFTVKGEVEGCDLVAVRDGRLVVVELKQSVNLTAILQCIDRKKLTDDVYLAVRAPSRRPGRRWFEVIRLCRMLSIGLIAVSIGRRGGAVEVFCEPGPYKPKADAKRRGRLLSEFERRSGDHNVGGSTKRPLVTAYREESLRVAAFLGEAGQAAVRAVRAGTGVERAGDILQDNYYRWFERVSRGVYRLSPEGERALHDYEEVLARLAKSSPHKSEP